jgi:hypothetical protein
VARAAVFGGLEKWTLHRVFMIGCSYSDNELKAMVTILKKLNKSWWAESALRRRYQHAHDSTGLQSKQQRRTWKSDLIASEAHTCGIGASDSCPVTTGDSTDNLLCPHMNDGRLGSECLIRMRELILWNLWYRDFAILLRFTDRGSCYRL